MLFSATQTTKVEDLARVSLRPKPLYINVDANMKHSTVETLEQGYVVCEADKRFLLLFSFLRRYAKKKIIVFFSSCQSVKYHAELLNFIDIPVLDLHVPSPSTPPPHPGLPHLRSSGYFLFRVSKTVLGQTKTGKTNPYILRIHKRNPRNPPLHQRRCPRPRHPRRRLDNPIRPSGRSTRLYPSCRPNGPWRWHRKGPSLPATLRIGIFDVSESCQSAPE